MDEKTNMKLRNPQGSWSESQETDESLNRSSEAIVLLERSAQSLNGGSMKSRPWRGLGQAWCIA